MHLTLSCLAKIAAKVQNMEVIVVDNASEDSVIEFVKSDFPYFKYIVSDSNLGFSKANNLGIKHATAENILLLNPDTLISEEVILSAIELLDQDASIGAVSVKMIDGRGNYLPESARSFPQLKSSVLKIMGLTKQSGYYMNPDETQCIEVMSGACMFFKKDVYLKIGGLDERYFMYGEDIDISYQIHKFGFKTKLIDTLEIVHFKGRSSVKSNWRYQTAFYNAMKIYWQKNFQWGQNALLNTFLNLVLWGLKLLSSLGHGIKQILLPILDFFGIIVTSVIFTYFWSVYVKRDIGFFPESYYTFVLPLYAMGAILSMLFAKFYLSDIDISRLVKASIANLIIFLGIYFVLPVDFKYSRAAIIMLWVISFFVPLMIRWLHSMRTNAALSFYDDRHLLANILPNHANEEKVKDLLEKYSNYRLISQSHSPDTVIMDVSQATPSVLIQHVKSSSKKTSLWFYSAEGKFLLKSHSKDASGFIIAEDENLVIYEWTNIVRKRILDIVLTPLALTLALFSRHSFKYIFRFCIQVIARGYSWVHVDEKVIFRLPDDVADDYKRNYSLKKDVNYFFRYMFKS